MSDDLIVEISGRRIYGSGWNGWGLQAFEGWWDSAPARLERLEIPGQPGMFVETEVPVGGRDLVIRGKVKSSSRAWAVGDRHWISARSVVDDLELRVFEEGTWLSARFAHIDGRARAVPDFSLSEELYGGVTTFELPISIADPRKYGRILSFGVTATAAPRGGLSFPIVAGALGFGDSGAIDFPGAFQIHNPGTAGFYPTFKASGPFGPFVIASESFELQYDAAVPAGQTLTLSPYLGGRASLDGADTSHHLLRADWIPVEGGQTRGYLFTPEDPGLGSQLEVIYPEGAWW